MRTARRMRLQGAGNVRDLGGYPCGETITAWQCCYRSDMLNKRRLPMTVHHMESRGYRSPL